MTVMSLLQNKINTLTVPTRQQSTTNSKTPHYVCSQGTKSTSLERRKKRFLWITSVTVCIPGLEGSVSGVRLTRAASPTETGGRRSQPLDVASDSGNHHRRTTNWRRLESACNDRRRLQGPHTTDNQRSSVITKTSTQRYTGFLYVFNHQQTIAWKEKREKETITTITMQQSRCHDTIRYDTIR